MRHAWERTPLFILDERGFLESIAMKTVYNLSRLQSIAMIHRKTAIICTKENITFKALCSSFSDAR